ncbi:BnaC04g24050D [Brassica napus]|uniref:(rape) hypothetical protein n=1 Tax=Brassica napus TaxID=3708 RepID=A0A078IET2_BRANA|nr:unnamed protein product [Brassica napus]CDY47668.1 BnaC04g24050D [Brassica napus]
MEFWRRKKKARKCFLKSGSMFLQQLIADCNGMSNPIRMFSSDQMSKATDHFDPMSALPNSFWFTLYKGVIEGRSYVIKRFSEYVVRAEEANVYNDIALSARVSNHSGFLKLIGCCLEFPRPIMVFEDLEYIAVNERGSLGSEDGPLLPWNVRLKIAKEIATAITYLHSAFPRIIIHRDICAKNVFLDKNGTAKLTDLTVAVTLPEGKSWIEDRERGEPVAFGGDSNDMRPCQMKMFLDLAMRCCEKRNEDRPKMITGNYLKSERSQVNKFAFRFCAKSVDKRPKMIDVAKEFNVAEKIAEVGGDIYRMSRNASVIQRKGYASDEELDELDSPLTFVIDKVYVSLSSGHNEKLKQQNEQVGKMVANVRYELLREVLGLW